MLAAMVAARFLPPSDSAFGRGASQGREVSEGWTRIGEGTGGWSKKGGNGEKTARGDWSGGSRRMPGQSWMRDGQWEGRGERSVLRSEGTSRGPRNLRGTVGVGRGCGLVRAAGVAGLVAGGEPRLQESLLGMPWIVALNQASMTGLLAGFILLM